MKRNERANICALRERSSDKLETISSSARKVVLSQEKIMVDIHLILCPQATDNGAEPFFVNCDAYGLRRALVDAVQKSISPAKTQKPLTAQQAPSPQTSTGLMLLPVCYHAADPLTRGQSSFPNI